MKNTIRLSICFVVMTAWLCACEGDGDPPSPAIGGAGAADADAGPSGGGGPEVVGPGCTPGPSHCEGSVAVACSLEGTGWQRQECAVSGQICQLGRCVPRAAGPAWLVAPASVTLAGVALGTTATMQVQVKSVGTEALRVDTIRLDAAPSFAVRAGEVTYTTTPDTQTGVALAPAWELPTGTMYTVEVTCTPVDGATATGTLALRTNEAARPWLSLPLSCTPGAPPEGPRVVATPSQISFGNVSVGETARLVWKLRNVGTADLTIERLKLDADSSFSVEVAGRSYTSTPGEPAGVALESPITVTPGAESEITVAFTPADDESARGELEVLTNDPENPWPSVLLVGNRGVAKLRANPGEVSFGPRVVGRENRFAVQLFSIGEAPVRVTGLTLAEGSSADFAAAGWGEDGELPTPDRPVEIAVNEFATFEVSYTPDAVNPTDAGTGQPIFDEGVLLVTSDTVDSPLEIALSGYGVLMDCPVAVALAEEGDDVRPQTLLHLVGDQSYAMIGTVTRYEWRVDQPVGSAFVLQPASTFPNPTFEANVAGVYTFHLDVWDENDVKSCESATYQVLVVPDEAIHVELFWHTPGDSDETDEGPFSGSDLDLHFMHPAAPSSPTAGDLDGDGEPDPYFDQPFDCYWFNPHPDWGSHGEEIDDNPGLDRDDTDGAGPENVNLMVPENDTSYRVAVHYWNDHGYGASYATVRIYVYGELREEIANVRLVNLDLWCVGSLQWPGGEFTPCEAEGYAITPNYRPPQFFP